MDFNVSKTCFIKFLYGGQKVEGQLFLETSDELFLKRDKKIEKFKRNLIKVVEVNGKAPSADMIAKCVGPAIYDSKEFYIKGSKVEFFEDHLHELKAHRKFTDEEIEIDKLYPRRKLHCLSRAINAFINSHDGGTVYSGVADNGTVVGFYLTHCEKLHVVHSLYFLLRKRYSPPVASSRCHIRFAPVVGSEEEFERLTKTDPAGMREYVRYSRSDEDHALFTLQPCWCTPPVCELMGASPEIMGRRFLIEIHIRPVPVTYMFSNPDVPVTIDYTKDEKNRYRFRMMASVRTWSYAEAAEQNLLLFKLYYKGMREGDVMSRTAEENVLVDVYRSLHPQARAYLRMLDPDKAYMGLVEYAKRQGVWEQPQLGSKQPTPNPNPPTTGSDLPQSDTNHPQPSPQL